MTGRRTTAPTVAYTIPTVPLPGAAMATKPTAKQVASSSPTLHKFGRQTLYLSDCLDWLKQAAPNSVHAVVTDPPYGLREYEAAEQEKMRSGKGGVWRIPPSFDGASRKPVPRFTVLTATERIALGSFFEEWGAALLPVLRPGGHVFIAGNPLLTPLVATAMEAAGFERRGEIVRLVRTLRGGDRPKGAHEEYPDISTMPRSCWEPWGLYRKPLSEPTVAANLKKWGTGALRRSSAASPFLDVIESGVLSDRERALAPHPSAKPQQFICQLVRAALPTGKGTVLDTFAGCATTLAACEVLGIDGVGVEIDPIYWNMAIESIPKLAAMTRPSVE